MHFLKCIYSVHIYYTLAGFSPLPPLFAFSSPDSLLLYFLPEKSRPPMDNDQTWYNNGTVRLETYINTSRLDDAIVGGKVS